MNRDTGTSERESEHGYPDVPVQPPAQGERDTTGTGPINGSPVRRAVAVDPNLPTAESATSVTSDTLGLDAPPAVTDVTDVSGPAVGRSDGASLAFREDVGDRYLAIVGEEIA